MTYNPKSPRILGPEWPVVRDTTKRVANSGTALGIMFKATAATEDIATVWPPISLSNIRGSLRLGIDIYSTDLASSGLLPQGVVPGYLSGTLGYVGTDTGATYSGLSGAAWVTDAGAAATYAAINDWVDTDYLKNVNPTDDCHCLVRLGGTTSDWRPWERYYQVYVEARVGSTMNAAPRLNGCLDIGGVRYYGPDYYLDPALGVQDVILHTWEMNPATGLPWTSVDLNNLTLNVTDEIGLRARWSNEVADGLRIYGLRLGWKWAPELRVAYGYVDLVEGSGSAYSSPITINSRPNFVRRANSDFDDAGLGVGTWAAETNCAIARSTTQFKDGAASLRLTSSANGDMSAKCDVLTLGSFQGPRTYNFKAWMRASATGRTCRLEVYDVSSGTLLATGTGAADNNAGWTAIDVTYAMPSGVTTLGLRVKVLSTGGGGGEIHYMDSVMCYFDECPTAYAQPGTEVASWHKKSGARYLMVLRRISGSGSVRIPAPEADVDCPHIEHHVVNMAILDQAGNLSIATYNQEDCALPVLMRTAAPATSADSQPYGDSAVGTAFGVLSQEITAPGTGIYSAIGLVLASSSETDPALTVNLKRRSDNVTVATATITRDMLNATPDELQWVVASFAAPITLTAQQYYVNLDLTGTGWSAQRLVVSFTVGDDVTFGGTTDIASWLNEAQQSTFSDFVTVLRPAIPTPGVLTATRVDA